MYMVVYMVLNARQISMRWYMQRVDILSTSITSIKLPPNGNDSAL